MNLQVKLLSTYLILDFLDFFKIFAKFLQRLHLKMLKICAKIEEKYNQLVLIHFFNDFGSDSLLPKLDLVPYTLDKR